MGINTRSKTYKNSKKDSNNRTKNSKNEVNNPQATKRRKTNILPKSANPSIPIEESGKIITIIKSFLFLAIRFIFKL